MMNTPYRFFAGLIALALYSPVWAVDTPVGMWRTYDDGDGLPASLVQIEERNGLLEGRVVKLLPRPGHDVDAKCVKCESDRKGLPITGMKIIWDMRPDGNEFTGGKIFDPDSGKTYGCRMKVAGNKLNVRGFLGMALFGRTQTWVREK